VEDAVIKSIDAQRQIIAIIGPAGSGKSVLLHRIAYSLAKKHLNISEQLDDF